MGRYNSKIKIKCWPYYSTFTWHTVLLTSAHSCSSSSRPYRLQIWYALVCVRRSVVEMPFLQKESDSCIFFFSFYSWHFFVFSLSPVTEPCNQGPKCYLSISRGTNVIPLMLLANVYCSYFEIKPCIWSLIRKCQRITFCFRNVFSVKEKAHFWYFEETIRKQVNTQHRYERGA